MKVMIGQPMNGRCEEDIKILEEMIENANIENMDMNNCFGGEHIEAIEHILSDYKRLQEEFKAVDSECSRLERKEAEQEKIIDLMAKFIEDDFTVDKFCTKKGCYADNYINGHCEKCLNCIKQYFINKAKEVK